MSSSIQQNQHFLQVLACLQTGEGTPEFQREVQELIQEFQQDVRRLRRYSSLSEEEQDDLVTDAFFKLHGSPEDRVLRRKIPEAFQQQARQLGIYFDLAWRVLWFQMGKEERSEHLKQRQNLEDVLELASALEQQDEALIPSSVSLKESYRFLFLQQVKDRAANLWRQQKQQQKEEEWDESAHPLFQSAVSEQVFDANGLLRLQAAIVQNREELQLLVNFQLNGNFRECGEPFGWSVAQVRQRIERCVKNTLQLHQWLSMACEKRQETPVRESVLPLLCHQNPRQERVFHSFWLQIQPLSFLLQQEWQEFADDPLQAWTPLSSAWKSLGTRLQKQEPQYFASICLQWWLALPDSPVQSMLHWLVSSEQSDS